VTAPGYPYLGAVAEVNVHHYHHYHNHSAHMASQQAAARREEEERRRRQEEEEILTSYSEVAMTQDWQFKIVHGDFSSAAKVRAVMQEQEQWGWVFVEKFDNARIRFKRPAGEAANDDLREGNPYSSKSKAAAASGCAGLLLLGFGFAAGVWGLAALLA
jgi:hypothetical protein